MRASIACCLLVLVHASIQSSHAYCNMDCAGYDVICMPSGDRDVFCCSKTEAETSVNRDCSGWCSNNAIDAVLSSTD